MGVLHLKIGCVIFCSTDCHSCLPRNEGSEDCWKSFASCRTTKRFFIDSFLEYWWLAYLHRIESDPKLDDTPPKISARQNWKDTLLESQINLMRHLLEVDCQYWVMKGLATVGKLFHPVVYSTRPILSHSFRQRIDYNSRQGNWPYCAKLKCLEIMVDRLDYIIRTTEWQRDKPWTDSTHLHVESHQSLLLKVISCTTCIWMTSIHSFVRSFHLGVLEVVFKIIHSIDDDIIIK